MDEAEARQRLLEHLGGARRHVVTSCRLSRRGTHWILGANTAAYVEHGDLSGAIVGVMAWVMDRATGEIDAWGSPQDPDDVLDDLAQAAEDAGRVWVFRPTDSLAATLRARQWLGCGPAEARALMRSGPWCAGPRRDVTELAAELAALGIPGEVERVTAATCSRADTAATLREGLLADVRRRGDGP